MKQETLNTKKHGWVRITELAVDELCKLGADKDIEKTMINLCQRGLVYKNDECLTQW